MLIMYIILYCPHRIFQEGNQAKLTENISIIPCDGESHSRMKKQKTSFNSIEGVASITPNKEIKTSSLLRKANGAAVLIPISSLEKSRAIFKDTRSKHPSEKLFVESRQEQSFFQQVPNQLGNHSKNDSENCEKICSIDAPPLRSHESNAIFPAGRRYRLEWPVANTIMMAPFDRLTLLMEPVFITGFPATAHDSESCLNRLNSLSFINSCTVCTKEIEFDSINHTFHLIPRNETNNEGSVLERTLQLKNTSISKAIATILMQSMTLSVDDFEWVMMQLRWIVWTFAGAERRRPSEHLFTLFVEKAVIAAVLWRCSLYFKDRFPFQSEYSLSSNSASSRLERKKPKTISAARHFSKRGSMSPLQRCSDILTLLWPLTVCFCTTAADGETSAMKRTGPKNSTMKTFEVTDGWWFSSLIIDEGLQNLVEKVWGLIFNNKVISLFLLLFVL